MPQRDSAITKLSTLVTTCRRSEWPWRTESIHGVLSIRGMSSLWHFLLFYEINYIKEVHEYSTGTLQLKWMLNNVLVEWKRQTTRGIIKSIKPNNLYQNCLSHWRKKGSEVKLPVLRDYFPVQTFILASREKYLSLGGGVR